MNIPQTEIFNGKHLNHKIIQNVISEIETLPRFTADYWVPDNQIEEHKHYFLLSVPLFGIVYESIKLGILNGIVSITGRRILNIGKENPIDNFRIDFALPKHANPMSIKTAIHNETLYVSIDKH